MFKFTPDLTFWWPVKVREPHPDHPGKLIEREFEAEFLLLDDDENKASANARAAILAKVTPDLDDAGMAAVREELEAHDRNALDRVLQDWRGIEDEDGNLIPFNRATFAAVYKHRRVREALGRAYGEAISEDKARLGN